MSTLLILGAGGHGRVVADAAQRQGRWRRILATDRDPSRCSGELLAGVPLMALEAALLLDAALHVAIGDAAARQSETAALAPGRLATVIHPLASVSSHAQVGDGCFIAAQAVVGPRARLGSGVIVNHGAIVDHDACIGDFCHIAPRAVLGGGVRLGARVLVGTGASVLPGLQVCADAVIGAGAVVHRPVMLAGVYAGLPARKIG